MDVERAETNIRQVSLTACIAGIVIWTLEVFIIRELVPRVQDLVCMHDLRALVEVTNSFFVLTRIYLHHATIEIVVLLVENVLFVVVRLFCLFCVRFIVALISPL